MILDFFAGKIISKELSDFFQDWIGLRYEDTGWPILTYKEINDWMIKQSRVGIFITLDEPLEVKLVSIVSGETILYEDFTGIPFKKEILDKFILYYLYEIRYKQEKFNILSNECLLFPSQFPRGRKVYRSNRMDQWGGLGYNFDRENYFPSSR